SSPPPAAPARAPSAPRPPWRWGRLLAMGLTLTLVATLATRAQADPDDGLAAGESLASEPVDQARGAPPADPAQTPANLVATPEGASSDARAITPTGDADAAVERQQAAASGPVAKAELRDQQPDSQVLAATGGVVSTDTQATAGKEQRDQGTQDESRRTAAACTDSSCQQPPTDSPPNIRAAVPWDPGGDEGGDEEDWGEDEGDDQPDEADWARAARELYEEALGGLSALP